MMRATPTRVLLASLLLGVSASLAAACSDDGGGPVGDDTASGAVVVPEAPVVEYTDWPVGNGVFKKPVYQDSCRYRGGTLLEWATNVSHDDTFSLEGPPNGPVTLGVSVIAAEGAVLSATVELADRSQTGRSWYTASGTATFGEGLERVATVVDGTLCLQDKTDSGADVPAEFSLVLDEGGATFTVGGSLVIPAAAVAGSDPISVSTVAADVDLR